MLSALDIGASGLQAQRLRLDTIAQNVANATTTRDVNGRPNPYQRRFVVLSPGQRGNPDLPGVHVQSIEKDTAPFQVRYEPGHRDADAAGYVQYPNVDLATEFVNALEATRAYEANITMMETTKSMFTATLKLIA
jgi:flagellar basal-body rod protein FlgC